jgi:Putative heavy-metal-binding
LREFKGKIMRISSTDVIEGDRVLYSIGKIKAASAWHAANGAPPQANWRELVVSELIRKAEEIDADAIIGLDYETDSIVPIEGTGVQLKRILATGVAVKLSCAA